jgi:hypothetical protein
MQFGAAIVRLNFWTFPAAGLALLQEADIGDRRGAEAREEMRWASRRPEPEGGRSALTAASWMPPHGRSGRSARDVGRRGGGWIWSLAVRITWSLFIEWLAAAGDGWMRNRYFSTSYLCEEL